MAHLCFCGSTFTTPELLVKHINHQGHHFQCACARLFAEKSAAENHLRDVVHPGNSTFIQHTSLQNKVPTKATTTVECAHCGRKGFGDTSAVEQHVKDKHFPCPHCHQIFIHAVTRLKHQKAAQHCYCAEHGMAFSSAENFAHHLRTNPHFASFECMSCVRAFATEGALEDHLASPGHAHVETAALRAEQEKEAVVAALKAREEAALKCEACNQTFKSLRGYKLHKASVKHNPMSELRCPLSDKCTPIFTSPSALLFHLESGRCKSGMDREKLNAVVYVHDTSRQITNGTGASPSTATMPNAVQSDKSRASVPSSRTSLHDDNDASTDAGSIIMTPDNSDAQSMISDFSGVLITPDDSNVDDSSIDGSVNFLTPSISRTSQSIGEWELMTPTIFTPSSSSVAASIAPDCEPRFDRRTKTWPCMLCKRFFRTKKAINQHLNSVAHVPKIFHCPIDLTGMLSSNKPTIEFKTLSGLAQHIETGACKGGVDMLRMVVGLFEKEIQTKLGKTVKLLKEG